MQGWRPDGPMRHDSGDVGGDVQAGPSHSLRFVHDTIGGAVVEVYTYAARNTGNGIGRDGADEEKPFWADCLVQFTVCDDVERPGDTETWADVKYENADPYTYSTKDEADTAAQNYLARYGDIDWDGQPFP